PTMVVQEFMSVKPFAIEASQTQREALHQLLSQDIRHLPVLDYGRLVGMLSDRDFRELATEVLSGEQTDQLSVAVSAVMSGDVISVNPETQITEVIDLMLEHKIGALPVVADDELVGIVSYIDVLRMARSALED